MKTVHPPITNDQELAGYRAAAARLERLIARHEDDLMAERRLVAPDPRKVNSDSLHVGTPVCLLPRNHGRDRSVACPRTTERVRVFITPGIGIGTPRDPAP